MKSKPTCYITTPIYYVNSKPHIGTLYSTLLADVTARWNRLLGKEVFFLTGTDEHGHKIEERAEQLNQDPKTFVDSMIPAFKEMWKRYELDYTHFIRTTDPKHIHAVEYWITSLLNKSDIYKSTYSGWYCVPCETFVTEVHEHDALCPNCSRPLKFIEEENYFFRLSAYQDALLDFYKKNPDFISPKERMNEVLSFVKSGLKDLSISRKGLKWGIPFPGDPSQSVYVWADALNNYISAVGYGSDLQIDRDTFYKWWPASVHIMAKDIVRFHAVYWPAFLMAAGLALPKKLLVHGYILSGNQKMSKSLGNVIDPQILADTYGVEQVRFYLMRSISPHNDSTFDYDELEAHINADLANNLGNLAQRMIVLALNNGVTTSIAPEALEPKSQQMHIRAIEAMRDYFDHMNEYNYHKALTAVFRMLSEINAFFNDQKPWELAKNNKAMFEEVISVTAHGLYMAALFLSPFMPSKMNELLSLLGQSFIDGADYEQELQMWNKSFTFKKPEHPLFSKIEKTKNNESETMSEKAVEPTMKEPSTISVPEIAIDDIAKVHIVVGTILSCEEVAGSDKLYKLQIDCGSYGKRFILSGIKKLFTPEQLIGKQGMVAANLKPRKMMGFESHGMLMICKNEQGRAALVSPSVNVENGTRLS